MYSTDLLGLAAETCISSFAVSGRTVSATVRESNHAIDLALVQPNAGAAVVRCLQRCTVNDVHALRAMIVHGDFDRAFIVYTEESEPPFQGEIPTYPLSRIDELAAALARESGK